MAAAGGPQLAAALVLLPGLEVGLLLLGVAGALAFGRYLPLPVAFAVAGLLAAAPGLVALGVLRRALLRAPPPLASTRAEVEGALQAL
ncbi:MAG: hypothetical protein FJ086_16890, partial [Deltaproteobacteria bacterium]|nr:hypothetical protein [Deltaproteobacteria bacterium]